MKRRSEKNAVRSGVVGLGNEGWGSVKSGVKTAHSEIFRLFYTTQSIEEGT